MMKDILQKVNKKTLIVSDVDGTILDNNGELDVETRNIINKYIKYGSFTIATGRSYTMACKILNGIKFDLPIITNDGACIYTPQGKMLKCFTIEQNKLLNKALDILYKTHTILSYSQYEGSEKVFWLGDLNKLTKIYFESRAGDNRFTQVENVKELFQGNVISISFIEDYKNSLKLRNQLRKIGIRDVFINKDAYIDGMYWVKIKNHFISILAYAEREECERIINFINDIMEEVKLMSFMGANTGNVVMDSLVGYWRRTAENEGIEFRMKLSIPIEIPFKGADMSLILGNLLENAVEGAVKAEKSKYISLNVKFDKGNLLIIVENSYSGELIKVKEELRTTKEDAVNHGIGLTSVRRAVKKYHGTMVIDDTMPERFLVRVVLYGK